MVQKLSIARARDRIEILDVIARLASTHDSMDLEGYRALFTEDVVRSFQFRDTEPELTESLDKSMEVVKSHLQMLSEKGI